MNIEYSVTNEEGIDIVAPLWKKLNEHHGEISRHFGYDYPDRKWVNRKNELLHDADGGKIRIDLARDADNKEVVGYCISSVKRDGLGEIDSIFVESDYRRNRIGDNLITSALNRLKEEAAKEIIVQVLVGNEEVHPFYTKYGFFPRTTILMRINENDTSGS
ncbi:MAG: GNAT family N-acetyltransferase [Dehalococcoidales bacterium]|nr:MAG: GNAT family N-acetyltransferase [Dehalococcoidales bacterium]